MAKVCPEVCVSSNSSYITSTRETFTIWMKSLVFNSNGCTVFNSKGELVFRIDNYQERSTSEVNLMDLNGQVLFSIQRKRLPFFGSWDIYKWSDAKWNKEGVWFQVKRRLKVYGSGRTCNVNLGWDKTNRSCYKIIESKEKSSFKIVDSEDQLVAEVKRKQSIGGVSFGDDVLSLVVESERDYSLVLALVTVNRMINCKL